MAKSITKHEVIQFSYLLDLASCTGMGMAMECTHLSITIRMDDAFTLNCRPTVPVGCEEQVVYHLFSFSSYATLKHLTIT